MHNQPSIPFYESDPEWLSSPMQTIREQTGSDPWRLVGADRLPPLIVDGRALNPEQVGVLLRAVRAAETGYIPESLLMARMWLSTVVRRAFDADVRDAFVWAALDRWEHRLIANQHWLLNLIPFMASEHRIDRLTGLVTRFDARKQPKFVYNLLPYYRHYPVDAALPELFKLSYRLNAHEQVIAFLNEFIKEKKLDTDPIADVNLPQFDLDATGGFALDYGARQLRVWLADDGMLAVREPGVHNRPARRPPYPTPTDDAEKAFAARQQFRTMARQMQRATRLQYARLEAAMVDEHRWSWDEFDRYYLQNPFMAHLIGPLVWGCFATELRFAFRLGSDGRFYDLQDREVMPVTLSTVGLVHPIYLDEAARAEWTAYCYENGIIQPFSQVDRGVFRLTQREREADTLEQLDGVRLSSGSIEQEKALGWTRSLSDVGSSRLITLRREYPKHGYRAFCMVDGDTLIFERLQFRPLDMNIRPIYLYPHIPPIMASEVLRDLMLIFSA